MIRWTTSSPIQKVQKQKQNENISRRDSLEVIRPNGYMGIAERSTHTVI